MVTLLLVSTLCRRSDGSNLLILAPCLAACAADRPRAATFAIKSDDLAPVDPSAVKTVHLVFSNHFDAGFCDFASNVLNRYYTGGPGTGMVSRPRRLYCSLVLHPCCSCC